jgi:putative peptidoglycan lipid II flippase
MLINKSILYSAVLLNLGLIIGRVSGFVRDLLFIKYIGFSEKLDIILLGFAFPDFITNLLIAGTLGTVIIPEIVNLNQNIRFNAVVEYSKKLTLLAFLLYLLIISGIHIFGTKIFFYYEQSNYNTLVYVIMISLLILPLTAVSAVLNAYLQIEEKFFVASISTLVINSSIILSVFLYVFIDWIYIIPIGLVSGGVLRIVIQYVNINSFFDKTNNYKIDKSIYRNCFFVIISGFLFYSFTFIAKVFASQLGTGEVSVLSYALRIYELFLVITTSIAVVIYPKISVKGNHDKEFCKYLNIALILSLLISTDYILYGHTLILEILNLLLVNNSNIVKFIELSKYTILILPVFSYLVYIINYHNSKKRYLRTIILNLPILSIFVLFLLNDINAYKIIIYMIVSLLIGCIIYTVDLYYMYEILIWKSMLEFKSFYLLVFLNLVVLNMFNFYFDFIYLITASLIIKCCAAFNYYNKIQRA